MIKSPAPLRHFVLILVSLIFVATATSACADSKSEENSKPAVETEELRIVSADGSEHLFHVEIAATPAAITQGLMYREEMAEDHGMLFLFARESERSFWMRNTLIPLDMLFINSEGVIRHIHENAIPLDETPVPSTEPVQMVLELNGGIVAKYGIKPGDQVYIGSSGK